MKTIAVFTSIRSEYGLLSPLLYKLRNHPAFELKLLVGGAHLLESFGNTIRFIEEDGFNITQRFPFLYGDQEEDILTRSISALQQQIGNYLSNNKPDLLMVLGDRFELIPVVLSATLYNIPIAHISGGETTEGAIDNQIRHAVTKMSHIHFPATEQYAANIRSMGEESWRICIAGEPGLDFVKEVPKIEKKQLFTELGLDIDMPAVLMTFHPETISNRITPDFVESIILKVLNQGYQIIATASNFDEGGKDINKRYEALASSFSKFVYHKSLGQKRYYSLLPHLVAMLGNSSSGIVEAQSFNLPVINVGDRQKGRLSNANVLNVPAKEDIVQAALTTINMKEFRDSFFGKSNIYGDGNACNRIISFLESIDWQRLLSKKDCFENN